jgi:hypothetical protein
MREVVEFMADGTDDGAIMAAVITFEDNICIETSVYITTPPNDADPQVLEMLEELGYANNSKLINDPTDILPTVRSSAYIHEW